MLRVAVANLRAHPVRLLATALAVVLGVAFVAGTLVFTDTVDATFDDFLGADDAPDVVVRPVTAFADSGRTSAVAVGVDEALTDVVADVAGVDAVRPDLNGDISVVGPDGEPVGGQGPPSFGVTWDDDDPSVSLAAGRAPRDADEVVVDAGTARRAGIRAGDTVDIVAGGPVTTYTVTGLLRFGDGDDTGLDSFFGATVVAFTQERARALFGADGAQRLLVDVAASADTADVRSAIADALDARGADDVEAVDGAAAAEDDAALLDTFLGFLSDALLVFAGVSLLVGGFIIFNTFTITVAQRTRETALLRAVGAGRAQVTLAVLVEALVVGAVASLLGVAAGVGLAIGLRALLAAFGLDLPAGDLVVDGSTVRTAFALGVVVTLVSSVVPALRATRVPPVAALQAVAAPARGRRAAGARVLSGTLVVLAGVGALIAGLSLGAGLTVVAAGAIAVLIGVALLAPVIAAPFATLVGGPIAAVRGVAGALARQNAARNPTRSASTAAALMIGLGLVAFVLIFVESLEQQIASSLDRAFLADLQLSAGFQGFPPGVRDRVADVDGVGVAAALATFTIGLDGDARDATALDGSVIGRVLAIDVAEGAPAGLTTGTIGLSADLAADLDVGVGDDVPVTLTPVGEPSSRRVSLTFDDTDAGVDTGQVWLPVEDVRAAAPELADTAVLVGLAEGADPARTRARVEQVLASYPNVQVQDAQQLRASVQDQTGQLVNLVVALLALSIVIALLGIVNTLGLSVLERTRELGLLRAVGMSRSQTRVMVRWEAVIVAVLGAVLGLGVGVLFGWLAVRALADEGFTTFSVPVGMLAVSVVLAAAAGVVAAVLPARRASRIDVLEALTVE